jgi:hypothetical protein
MQKAAARLAADLPRIPVFCVGANYPLEVALAYGERGYDLLAMATEGVPRAAVRAADTLSRVWLQWTSHPYHSEITDLARRSREPGLYYFNSHYEWGCTTAAKPAADGNSVRLMRAFDWRTCGLGRHVVGARVAGPAGPWVTLTWPAYTGVLHGMAPGRFSAALNQAPRAAPTGWSAIDWLIARRRMLASRGLTPVHLLRRVFEAARTFEEALAMLRDAPVCAPVIYTLAGLRAGEACVIERQERAAHVISAPADASCANDWQCRDWQARRIPGRLSEERLAKMQGLGPVDVDPARPWASWPIVNAETKLVMVADARAGRIVAQGYEESGPATAVLDLVV